MDALPLEIGLKIHSANVNLSVCLFRTSFCSVCYNSGGFALLFVGKGNSFVNKNSIARVCLYTCFCFSC